MTSWSLFQDIFILRRARVAISFTSSNLQPCLLKKPLKPQKKKKTIKKLEIMY